MRNSYWLVAFLLGLECVVLLIEPSECIFSFIPVSVNTALQILTLLVKIKSIIFKILLGLKLMGVEGFIMRRRRRSIISTDEDSQSYLDSKMESLPESQRTELLMAWGALERVLGQSVRFQKDVCVRAATSLVRSKRPITIWDGLYLTSSTSAESGESSNNNTVDDDVTASPPPQRNAAESQSSSSYSHWVSSVLGSSLGSPYACHILQKQLQSHSPSPLHAGDGSNTDSFSITNSLVQQQTGAFS